MACSAKKLQLRLVLDCTCVKSPCSFRLFDFFTRIWFDLLTLLGHNVMEIFQVEEAKPSCCVIFYSYVTQMFVIY